MKPFIVAILVVLASLPAAAQSSDVVLSNPEDLDFYYVLDPPELAGFDSAGSIFPTVIYDYFSATRNGPPRFEPLPSGASRRLKGLDDGTHLLVGFFVPPGRREFPVRVLRLQVGEGLSERFYSIYSQPALVSVRAGRGRLAEYPALPPRLLEPKDGSRTAQEPAPVRTPSGAAPAEQKPTTAASSSGVPEASLQRTVAVPAAGEGFFGFRIDNRYDDWEAIPLLAVFASSYRPDSFTRERFGRQLEVLPLRESRRWGKGGTAIHEVKIVRDERAIYLFVSTHKAISEDLSFFLYLQRTARGTQKNLLTIELVPETPQAPGLVVLWEKDEEPVIVGRLASAGFFLEAIIPSEVLLPYLETVPGLSYFDLTSCYFDRGELIYEEFYFGSPAFGEIPTPDSLF